MFQPGNWRLLGAKSRRFSIRSLLILQKNETGFWFQFFVAESAVPLENN
ncbi:hypothetical protein QE396_004575 [Enterobacter sp. SORGH_AS 287]|nr:hypothetical protein [Enterobacter sp. SORGH_AS_0287]